MQSQQNGPALATNYEGFLEELETCVAHAGKLQLITGEQLRLEITLMRHEKSPRVIWGLKRHEDWAFKATLLRFARGLQPVHLILLCETAGTYDIWGWVVRRTMHDFWATPLITDQAQQFWDRSPASFAPRQEGSA